MMNERIWRLGSALVGIAIAMDILATMEGVSHGYREMNPVVRYFMEWYGVESVAILGLIELGALVAIGHLVMRRLDATTALFVYTLVIAITASWHLWTAIHWTFLITGG